MKGLKRTVSLLLVIGMMLMGFSFGVKAEDGVVVKSYPELLEAVNEQKADRILISSKYKQKGRSEENIEIEAGRTVTLLPEKGDSVTMTARIDAIGEGNLVFENVNLVGPDGSIALWIGEGIHVTAGSVTGGKAKGNHGNTAVIIDGAHLTIDQAKGSDGTSGLGGDAIYAYGNGTVTVREAKGGTAKKGVGGAGVVAFAGAQVTVTGSSTGGDGLYGAGKGALVGLNGSIGGEGVLTDGTLLPSKKAVDPTNITNLALLQNAIRNGETEIQLSAKYKSGGVLDDSLYQFAMTEDTVKITGSQKGKKLKLDYSWQFYAGTWELDGIDFTSAVKEWEPCLMVSGDAKVTLKGNITVKNVDNTCVYAREKSKVSIKGNLEAPGNAVLASDNASVTLKGKVKIEGKEKAAVKSIGKSKIKATGNITVTGNGNALSCVGGKITLTGDIETKKNVNYPTVFINGGEVKITGTINNNSQAHAIYCKGGKASIEGDINSKATDREAVYMLEAAEEITIKGNLNTVSQAVDVNVGKFTLEGNIVVRCKGNVTFWSKGENAEVIITGTMDRFDP